MNGAKIDGKDHRIERVIGYLLQAGVLAAGLIVLTGGVMYLARYGHSPASGKVFHGEPSDLCCLRGILARAFVGRSRGIIQLGLLLLIATPMARVVLSLAAFAWERDWTYILLTLVVLAVLGFGLWGG